MTEKKLHTLIIDPEFRNLIPLPNDEELTMLEESIVANGCESPLIVWNGVIVDGHNRHAMCQKHGIPFAVSEKSFDSREDAMLRMLRNQLGRRNLNSYQRGELALKFEPLIVSASKKRMLVGKSIALRPVLNSFAVFLSMYGDVYKREHFIKNLAYTNADELTTIVCRQNAKNQPCQYAMAILELYNKGGCRCLDESLMQK